MGNSSSTSDQTLENQPLINTTNEENVVVNDQSTTEPSNQPGESFKQKLKNLISTKDSNGTNSSYIHPLINLITVNTSDDDIINTLDAYCGIQKIGDNLYDIPDQYEVFGPVTQLFCHCACYGRRKVVEWIMNNYVPLDVSYSDNFCYFECLRYGHKSIAAMLVQHESFNGSIDVLLDLLNRQEYNLFNNCISRNNNLDQDLKNITPALVHLVNTGNIQKVKSTLLEYKNTNKINAESFSHIDVTKTTNNIVTVSDEPITVDLDLQQESVQESVQEPVITNEMPSHIPGPNGDSGVSNDASVTTEEKNVPELTLEQLNKMSDDKIPEVFTLSYNPDVNSNIQEKVENVLTGSKVLYKDADSMFVQLDNSVGTINPDISIDPIQ
uniref:Ankyrin repeat protein n=1 Tax=Moumouvirus sp. 'Monve' TaxID=1128131 RepID=H2EDU0_9VIRU|nr:hypothetical protein mv_L358 [Moumouvirus Monve]